jgi:hypothetical protein
VPEPLLVGTIALAQRGFQVRVSQLGAELLGPRPLGFRTVAGDALADARVGGQRFLDVRPLQLGENPVRPCYQGGEVPVRTFGQHADDPAPARAACVQLGGGVRQRRRVEFGHAHRRHCRLGGPAPARPTMLTHRATLSSGYGKEERGRDDESLPL